ncbi:hypothetical protein [Aeromonas enterica]
MDFGNDAIDSPHQQGHAQLLETGRDSPPNPNAAMRRLMECANNHRFYEQSTDDRSVRPMTLQPDHKQFFMTDCFMKNDDSQTPSRPQKE